MFGWTSELHRAGWDVELAGVELLPLEWRPFGVPAFLQHLMHLLWRNILI